MPVACGFSDLRKSAVAKNLFHFLCLYFFQNLGLWQGMLSDLNSDQRQKESEGSAQQISTRGGACVVL